jgi:hypothetical protein
MSGFKPETTTKSKNTAISLFDSTKSRLIKNLKIQLKCAEGMVSGNIYYESVMKTVTDQNGRQKIVPLRYSPKRWYWRGRDGNVSFCLRIFNKRLEIENGETDIFVGKDNELPGIVKLILDAVIAGEYDKYLRQALAQRQERNAR